MSIQNLKVSPEHNDLRLDVYLTQVLSDVPSRNVVKKLIEFGHVRVNESIVKANYKVSEKDDIFVEIPANFLTPKYVEPENVDLDIFYEDEFLFVINKPRGMLVHPTATKSKGTLVNALLHHSLKLSNVNSDIRPGIVHRLDQETSGLMLVAKDNITHTKLAKKFKRHEVKKRYVALVEGCVEFDEGRVDVAIGKHPHHHEKKAVSMDGSGKDALTTYKVLQRKDKATLVALYPKTGRMHQLRVHMRYLKHPILGDDKYGHKRTFPRLALHAQAISFQHPRTNAFMEFVSKTPDEFYAFIKQK